MFNLLCTLRITVDFKSLFTLHWGMYIRSLTLTQWETLDGFASKTYSVYFGSCIHHFTLPLIGSGLEQKSPELPQTCKA